ncbi:MAG: hypothetical protein R6V85_09170 [Polyangia bacterium]
MKDDIIEVVLLLALPASGKSEVRRYLEHLDPEQCRERFHIGPTIQLDDYPYVHAMRLADEALQELGEPRAFFAAADRGFVDPVDWETLIALVEEDYEQIRSRRRIDAEDPGRWLADRIDVARETVGAGPALPEPGSGPRRAVEEALGEAAAELAEQLDRLASEGLEGKTTVIEFARGGPQGTAPPLPPHHGYAASLPRLSSELLERAAILYIQVTPEQSRAKNRQRSRPGEDGSILFHGVPENVLRSEYGSDDIQWLIERSDLPDTVQVEARGRVFRLPAAIMDNRGDLTTFLRGEPESWREESAAALGDALAAAFRRLWRAHLAERAR